MESAYKAHTGKPKIKVGILLNSYKVSYPYYHILETLIQSDYAELSLVVLNKTRAGRKRRVSISKLIEHFNLLFFFAYQIIDQKLFKPRYPIMKQKDCRELLKGIPVIETTPETKKFFQWIDKDDIQNIHSYNCDLFIRMGFRILRGDILRIARYGIWSFHHADNKVNRGGPPCFWEMYEKNPVTGTIVQVLSSDLDNGKVLYKTYGATHKFSLNVSRNGVYAKAMFFIPRLISKLHHEGPGFLNETPQLPEFYSHPLYLAPTNLQTIKFVWRLLTSSFTKFIRQFFYRNQWFLMYSLSKTGKIQPSMRKLKKMIPPKGTFWADPHVIFRDGYYYIFLEEKFFNRKNAHISVIKMDEEGNYGSAQKVLELPYHLSYPFVFSHQNCDYMIPESGANKTIELYKCESFPDKWKLHKVLMQDVQTVDTTLHFHNGKWWMFVNKVEHPAVSNNDELHIYHSVSPEGPWEPHRLNPVISDVRRARPAGKIFEYNGKFYRPSQDCSVTYGYGIRINEIITLNEAEYHEKETDFIEPLWDDKINGVHTFIFEKNLTLIDGVRKVSKWS